MVETDETQNEHVVNEYRKNLETTISNYIATIHEMRNIYNMHMLSSEQLFDVLDFIEGMGPDVLKYLSEFHVVIRNYYIMKQCKEILPRFKNEKTHFTKNLAIEIYPDTVKLQRSPSDNPLATHKKFVILFDCALSYKGHTINKFTHMITAKAAVDNIQDYVLKRTLAIVTNSVFSASPEFINECLFGKHDESLLTEVFGHLIDHLEREKKGTHTLNCSFMGNIGRAAREYVPVNGKIGPALRNFLDSQPEKFVTWSYMEAEDFLITVTSGGKYPMVGFTYIGDGQWQRNSLEERDIVDRFRFARPWLRPQPTA